MAARYPLPRPVDDDRFTVGLLIDVADVLAAHGYPEVVGAGDGRGADLVALQLALFKFLYAPAEIVSPVRVIAPAGPTRTLSSLPEVA